MTKRGITPTIARRIREEKGLKETKLQRIRVNKGLSQKDLSEISGITVRAIQNYEQRHRPIESAKLNTLCSLCMALHCKIEDILEDPQTIKMLKATK